MFYVLAISALCAGFSRGAITESSVLVLYNQSDSQSVEIASYYAQTHPGVQLLGLTEVTTSEEVTADYYLSTIRPQILNSGKLTNSVSTIVTTKGLPLRIRVTESNPGTYTDPNGVLRTVDTGWWKPYSSLESELTRITQVSTWQQMGDQTYYASASPAANPYYGVNSAFNYSTPSYNNMRLTARLDGFSTADIKDSIDRAKKAFLLPGSYAQYIVMDDDPNSVGQDRMAPLKTLLTGKSYPYVYESTDAAVTTANRPVIGYVSHGTNDRSGGLETGYIVNQLDFNLANGAVFTTHESYNAYSFVSGNNVSGQGLVAEWLATGGTAAVGNVQEPSSGTIFEANEDQMFKMLLSGYTWAEAAWSSLKQLSYVNTVVGDPLMKWKVLLPGDANMDGKVGVEDLSLLGAYWQNYDASKAGGYWWGHGDFNCDGRIDINDFSLLGVHWGQVSDWAPSGSSSPVGPLDMNQFLASIPEPPSLILVVSCLGPALILACRRRGHRRPSALM